MKIEERLKEIIRLANELGWLNENPNGYPLMELSEVEKCMTALYDDFEFVRMKKWVKELEKVRLFKQI